MRDGSIYAGLTEDGTQRIFAMPEDAGITMTFNEAVTWIGQRNAYEPFGHADWEIPDLDTLHVLYLNQGLLKNTFSKEAGTPSDCPYYYWSSTAFFLDPSRREAIRFVDGSGGSDYMTGPRYSCRAVRLEPVAS